MTLAVCRALVHGLSTESVVCMGGGNLHMYQRPWENHQLSNLVAVAIPHANTRDQTKEAAVETQGITFIFSLCIFFKTDYACKWSLVY